MKKIAGLFLIAVLVMSLGTSCKSKQKVVQISGADIEASQRTKTTPISEQELNDDRTLEESFSMANGETNSEAYGRKYHVVVGSFSVQSNAKNLQRKLNQEGNNVLIVINEQGMYRVLLASYDSYAEAKNRISLINSRFPDAWILRKK